MRAKQILDKSGANLQTLLDSLALIYGTKSITFGDGTILKWGILSATASIGANSTLQVTTVFPVQFPTQCDFFHALMTPASTTDFYGVTSLVSRAAANAVVTVRNGATAQACSGGIWIAIGR